VSDLLIGLLSAVLATNQPAAISNLVQQKAGITVSVTDKNDPIEIEFRKVMEMDDAAQEEADKYIAQEKSFTASGAGGNSFTLNERLKQKFEPVKKAYQDFLQKHPDHARAHLAYGSFLDDTGEEDQAMVEWEKGRSLDPKNPAAWDNLANYYGHNGPVTNAFIYYAKAIELNPNEPIYFQNLATAMYLFRRDATNFFNISEEEVFATSMMMYRKALSLDPVNFILATDYAQSYYGFKPRKTGNPEADKLVEQKHFTEALAAWETTLKLASDDIQRQGVYIHFARLQIDLGRLDEARKNLDLVTNEQFSTVKKTLLLKLEKREKPQPATP
jgi:tetratricopeptide (TPR) repeat protein